MFGGFVGATVLVARDGWNRKRRVTGLGGKATCGAGDTGLNIKGRPK
jgi:hypothetical protein